MQVNPVHQIHYKTDRELVYPFLKAFQYACVGLQGIVVSSQEPPG
jgi:hypothetical protein